MGNIISPARALPATRKLPVLYPRDGFQGQCHNWLYENAGDAEVTTDSSLTRAEAVCLLSKK